jgi:hypothetical protein
MQVRMLIWLYFWLIIFEGALRKWVFPSLSDPLLLIRDPVVLLIYFQAIRGNFFPNHWLVRATLVLGVFTFFWGSMHAYAGGSKVMVLVTLYGVRTYFLHLPLIFIMGKVFTRQDVIKLGKWCLLLSIPMALLMAAQYKVDLGHWLNRGTQGEEGGQLMAAMGKVRPPGTFSFITGPATFYPLIVVYLVYGIMDPKAYPKWLLLAAAGATALALPISGSRTLVLSCALVLFFALIALIRIPRLIPRFLLWGAVIGAAGIALLALPVGRQAVESFTTRWDEAIDFEGEGKGAGAGISTRVGGNFTEVFYYLDTIPIEGYGIGAGTNVGVKLMTGGVGFLLGEGEWTRNVMEAGPILGFAYIGFRILFAVFLALLAWRKIGVGDPFGWLFMSCAAISLIIGQTAQPTTLGFMALISGLSLSAVGVMQEFVPMNENRRMWLEQRAQRAAEKAKQARKPAAGTEGQQEADIG